MTSKEAIGIFYIKQEIESLNNQINFLSHSVVGDDATSTDLIDAVQYDGMPHNSSWKKEAPYEKKVIRLIDMKNRHEIELREAVLNRMNQLESLSKRFEDFMKTINNPKYRAIVQLRCMEGLSFDDIGNKLKMDRRTVSKYFYKAFGEYKKK